MTRLNEEFKKVFDQRNEDAPVNSIGSNNVALMDIPMDVKIYRRKIINFKKVWNNAWQRIDRS